MKSVLIMQMRHKRTASSQSSNPYRIGKMQHGEKIKTVLLILSTALKAKT